MWSKLKFLLRYTHRYRWWYAGGIVFLALTIWASVTIPEYIQTTIDAIALGRVDSSGDFCQYLGLVLLLASGLLVVRSLSRVLFFVPGRLVARPRKGERFRMLWTLGK